MYCDSCSFKLKRDMETCPRCGKHIPYEKLVSFKRIAKTWIIFCMILQGIIAAVSFYNGNPIAGVIVFISALGYVILYFKKLKIGYFILVGTIVILFIYNLWNHVPIWRSLFGLIDPAVTFWFIHDVWKHLR